MFTVTADHHVVLCPILPQPALAEEKHGDVFYLLQSGRTM